LPIPFSIGDRPIILSMHFPRKRYLCTLFFCLFAAINSSRSIANAAGFQSGQDNTASAPFTSGQDRRPAEEKSSWRKWEKVPVKPLSPSSRSSSSSRLPAEWLIRFYKKYVSPVDGASCTYYPSCSTYGLQAIRRNGLLLGIPMTAERVMRNHHPHHPERYPLFERNGNLYYLDPVGSNDFWWHASP